MAFTYLGIKTKTKKNQKLSFRLRIGILALFILLPNLAQARIFNPSNIITDEELLDKNSLSQTAIQKFLERENSVLARYSQIIENETLKVSEMIWEISQKHNISPKFLLTTLEKEQGLIHSTQATEKALDWATGYGCYGGTCKEKYRGFYNQVEASAETQEIYWQKAGQFAFGVGKTTESFDGYEVTPANKATANLYIYTPYVGYSPELGVTQPYGGNRLFWRIWHRYFTNQKFLDGQVVKEGTNFWLIQNNQKRKFISQDLFLADYKLSDAITTTASNLAAYPEGTPVSFSDGTLVKSATSGQIYLLAENQKRPIIDNGALALLNDFQIAVTANEIPAVADSLLTPYSLGSIISSSSIYPQGKLFEDETGKIFLVQDGLKKEVDSLVWQNRFDSAKPELTTAAELEKYPAGGLAKLKDGTFVTIDNKYYLISNGERMKIEDLGIFDRVFGADKKNNALKVSTALLEAHQSGDMIDYIDDTVKDTVTNNSTPVPSVTAGNYSAAFDTMSPESLILVNGQTSSVTLTFKNNGSTTWQNGDIWLIVTDKGQTTSLFEVADKVNFSESSVATGQTASFTFDLTAPTDQSGLLTQEFNLYYNKDNSPAKLISIGKFIVVKAGLSAQILEENIPVAVKNTWKPISITMKIKNTSTDTTWLSRKTALAIYNEDGTTSYFYDPSDWVREEVAAVPVGKTYIKPGETGEFKFTLDPRGIKKGTYILKFQLKLLDKDKIVFLDGQEKLKIQIRVD